MWSIAIYNGITPFDLQPAPPILTKSDITDIPADFVADPFMLHRDNTWYMFFEVMHSATKLGEIGLATSGDDAQTWTYQRIVLRESPCANNPSTLRNDGATVGSITSLMSSALPLAL